MKKLLLVIVLIAAAMCLSTTALADGIYYLGGASEADAVIVDLNEASNGSGTLTLSGGGYYKVIDNAPTTRNVQIVCTAAGTHLIVSGVTVNTSSTSNACALSFTGAGNELLLDGVSSFSSGNYEPGIRVEIGTALTIDNTSSTTGSISAYGGDYGAGIGGGYYSDGGTITISGGTITTAQGGYGGAGIGGGSYGATGGAINISGGTITTAQGGTYGAGIGGGRSGTGGSITISSGTITGAYGGDYGAGIGGGYTKTGGTITVSGGTIITAEGGGGASGIGGGNGGAGGSIIISSGTITTAQGGYSGAGIGGGYGGTSGTINISGGTITTAQGGADGAGIGSGSYSVENGTITISGGTIITAQGGNNGAGIGGGNMAPGGTITISGGTIENAHGGDYGAGIGGGNSQGVGGAGGTITISNGAKVYAAAGTDTSDIGPGFFGYPEGTLTINGSSTVVFIASSAAFSGATLNDGIYFTTNTAIMGDTRIEHSINNAPWNTAVGLYCATYYLSYNANTSDTVANLPGNEVVIYGDKTAEPAAPTRAGYIFDGWYKEPSCTNPWVFASDTVTADTTLYANWLENFTVSYNDNVAAEVITMPADEEVADGGYAAEPTDPTRAGYTFDGWYKEESCTNPWVFASDAVTADTTLYAKWLENFTVSYNDNVDTEVITMPADEEVADGGYAAEPADPTRAGYTFDGWYKEESCANPWIFASDTVTADTTLYAKWLENFTVSYDDNVDTEVITMPADEEVADGGYAAEPADPTRAGYAFDGWYKEESCTNPWVFASDTVTADTTLYAKWIAGVQTITYAPNGGNGSGVDYTFSGAVLGLKDGTGFTKAGYVIDGWSIEGTDYLLAELYTVPGRSVTADAIWAADTDGDGVSDKDETIAGTNPINPSDVPEKGTIKITVYNQDGTPRSGATCVLNSTPIISVTNTNGSVSFNDIYLASHILTLRDGNQVLGQYTFNFTQGTNNTAVITDDASTDSIGHMAITITDKYLYLDATIRQNAAGYWELSGASVITSADPVVNPSTGDDSREYLWILLVVLSAVLAGSGALLLGWKAKKHLKI